MAVNKLRVVHYLNQFFGQVGGEDRAGAGLSVKEGPVGPGRFLQKELGDRAEVVATLICGDNYCSQRPEETAQEALHLMQPYKPDIFFAGPAFEAGRYGIACGAMCKAVGAELGIPVITGMYKENPGVEMYRKHAFICKTGRSARDMTNSLQTMTRLALRLDSGKREMGLVSRENLPNPDEYGYFTRLLLRNACTEKTAAARAVDKLLAKIRDEPFESEVILPQFDAVEPPLPVQDLGICELALASDGGLVPKGNPDGLSGRGNLRWTTYEIAEFLPEEYDLSKYEVAHTGYFPDEILGNPNRLVPIDVLRDLAKEGKIGKVHPTFFCTSGNATVTRRCAEMGTEMAALLKERGVDAVILTST